MSKNKDKTILEFELIRVYNPLTGNYEIKVNKERSMQDDKH